jgi:asparagine synthase (glutamine-hydrolysing)
MCGIAGIVAPEVARHGAALERMVSALRHRGPDGLGSHLFRNCGLGHARLSIVDLKSGEQPMFSRDGAVGITFNGEIYGFREIRERLRGYDFHTTSDTEVMLALYEEYGEGMAPHLPGMFAFALWDDAEQSLFVARDRFGEKPFYYAWGPNGELLFASEIKSLLASGLVRPKLNRRALGHYLKYLYVNPNETIYSNVFTLPPAHSLSFREGRLEVRKYWELPAGAEPVSEQEAVGEFRRLFERAVERQLVADVPVGAFLSGGLDSSSVVAVASRSYPRLKTFSFGFRDSLSELPHARAVAEMYGTDHVELEDEGAPISDLLVEMARVYDEPFADSSNIPTYLISQSASRHGKVALTGDGGDELLGGYSGWYRPLWEMERGGAYPSGTASLVWRAMRVSSALGLRSPEAWGQITRGVGLRRRYESIARAHAKQKEVFDDAELERLGLDVGSATSTNGISGAGGVDDAMRMDLRDYMPGDILVKIDRASMAHGLELRAPFLDVDFASFCISLPSRLKITARDEKWILRRSFAESWPESIRTREKCGFGAPVGSWLERPDVAALKARVLDDSRHALFSLIPFGASRESVARGDYRTWALLVLGLWLEHGGEASL